MKSLLVFILIFITSALSAQSYIYQWYPGINQRLTLNNKYTDSLRIRINKPMGMHKVRYDIDVYTVGNACMITHRSDSTGWVGSRNKGQHIKGYAHFINGRILYKDYPCDSIPLGHLDEWHRWHNYLEDCNDFFRYTIVSYSNEEFTIHFNRHDYNVLHLYVHATALSDTAPVAPVAIGKYNALGQPVMPGHIGAVFSDKINVSQ